MQEAIRVEGFNTELKELKFEEDLLTNAPEVHYFYSYERSPAFTKIGSLRIVSNPLVRCFKLSGLSQRAGKRLFQSSCGSSPDVSSKRRPQPFTSPKDTPLPKSRKTPFSLPKK